MPTLKIGNSLDAPFQLRDAKTKEGINLDPFELECDVRNLRTNKLIDRLTVTKYDQSIEANIGYAKLSATPEQTINWMTGEAVFDIRVSANGKAHSSANVQFTVLDAPTLGASDA